MRYLRVSIHQSPSVRHPMHEYIVETEGYTVSRLLQMAPPAGGSHAMLFHIEGPPQPYESVIEDVDRVIEYELSPCPDDSFYLYVRERLSDQDAAFLEAFSQPGLVGLTPVEYRADGTVRLTVVGPAETLQNAVEETPDHMDVDVLEIGDYDARRMDAGSALTDRQFEAVAAAVDCDYYDNPRDGSVADIADRLDCAPGTAAELLRRAERTVMSHVVSNSF
jgi:hypothetical protein